MSNLIAGPDYVSPFDRLLNLAYFEWNMGGSLANELNIPQDGIVCSFISQKVFQAHAFNVR